MQTFVHMKHFFLLWLGNEQRLCVAQSEKGVQIGSLKRVGKENVCDKKTSNSKEGQTNCNL